MMDMREVELKRLKLVLLRYISKDLGDELAIMPEVELFDNMTFMADEIVARIKVAIWGRNLEEETVRYPANWWQAVKDRWLPRWAKKRWPVHYRTVKLTAKELYPKLSLPDHGPVLVITKTEPLEYDEDDDALI